MNSTVRTLLKAGWTIVKYTAIAGGAIMLTLNAPAAAIFVGVIPVAAWAAEKTLGDPALTIMATAGVGIVMATLMVAAPEAAILLTALGIYELTKRWRKLVMLREELRRRNLSAAA